MGMAAGQARLLSITSRLSDNELRAQVINNQKMRLASQSSQVSEAYTTALNEAQMMFTNYDANNNATYQQLTFNALTGYNQYNNQYALSTLAGQVLVSEKDAKNFAKANGDLNTFLSYYGLEQNTTYFEEIQKSGTSQKGTIVYSTGQVDEDGYTIYEDSGLTAEELQKRYEGYDDLHPGYLTTVASEDYFKYTSGLSKLNDRYDSWAITIADNMQNWLTTQTINGKSFEDMYSEFNKSEDEMSSETKKAVDTYLNALKTWIKDDFKSLSLNDNKTYVSQIASSLKTQDTESFSQDNGAVKVSEYYLGDSNNDPIKFDKLNPEIQEILKAAGITSENGYTGQVDVGGSPNYYANKRLMIYDLGDGEKYALIQNNDSNIKSYTLVHVLNELVTNEDGSEENVLTYEKLDGEFKYFDNINLCYKSSYDRYTYYTKSLYFVPTEEADENGETDDSQTQILLQNFFLDAEVKLYTDDDGNEYTGYEEYLLERDAQGNKVTAKTVSSFQYETTFSTSEKIQLIKTALNTINDSFYNLLDPYSDEFKANGSQGLSAYNEFRLAAVALATEIFGADYNNTVIPKIQEKYPDLREEDILLTLNDPFKVMEYFELAGMNTEDNKYFQKFQPIYDVEILDRIMNTYGEPKYTWIDKNNPNENGEAKAQWYINLFTRMQDGYKALQDGLANSTEWIKYAFESGFVTLQQVDDTQSWNNLIYTNCSDITEQTNNVAITVAEAEYNAAMNKIENKDKMFDLELKNIDTEHNSLQTEYDSIKTAIDKNIERTFKMYS